MSESDVESSSTALNFEKAGNWNGIIAVCDNISSTLESVKPADVNGKITASEFANLSEEWNEWKPKSSDDFSDEMIEKTAEQSSVSRSKLEEEGKRARDEVKDAGNSIVQATEEAEEEDFEGAKNCVSDAVKSTGRAVDAKVRQGFRKVEEGIYKKAILKANSLYFDNSVLSAVLSKRMGADSSEKYQLSLSSNNPHLRELLAERIDWDEC